MSEKSTLIHWFRKGLRVHDNPALSKVFQLALENPQSYNVRPIFILDPGIVQWLNVGANRWRFLQQTLSDLNKQLIALNSRLYVVKGSPATVFPRLFKEWQAQLLTFEEDIEPFSLKRDKEIKTLAAEHKVEVETFWSHTVFNPYVVLSKNMGTAPMTYQKFLSVIEKMKATQPEEVPKKLKECKVKKDSWEKKDATCYDVPSLEDLVKKMDDLGMEKFPGGETEGLRRMQENLAKGSWVATFEKPNTAPNSLEPSTTVLSPYLKFGCLSSRLFHQKLLEVLKKHPKHSKPPVSLMGQLYWREFYYTGATAEPNYDRMMGNAVCMQIPWQVNNAHLEAWTWGRTGYPFIDAIMRQLRQEGWIHHLARHAVACFLTRGDLWISWEEGQKVFEELLLDQDWALNAGNWMWLSASAYFYQYFRVYSPVAFGKKTDPTGKYIRKYVPELKEYPAGAIYEPWKVSLADQRKYGCVLGEGYPHRIVNHEIIHKENIKRMSAAYKINREVKTGKEENENVAQEKMLKRKRANGEPGTSKKRK